MPETGTHIELTGIATVLEQHKLAVPVHQRSFEWTSEEVRELLEDVQGAFSTGQEEYFLGSLVVIAATGSDRKQVLDGQQRLATMSLLLAGIADGFETLGDRDRADAVRRYLASYDIDMGVNSPQIQLNQDDDPYFRKLLRSEYAPPVAGAPVSHTLLYSAREQTRKWLASTLSKQSDGITWLVSLFKYSRESVRVILFRVPDDANAYLIFETLNDRGLDLSIADLLKNYLLGRADAAQENVLSLWSRTLSTLKAHGLEERFTVFLRHYWSSRYDVVREKDLYRRIKSRITNPANVLDLAEDLAKNSYLYSAIASPDHEYWGGTQAETRERLKVLNVLGLEQYRPMLLAVLVHFELPEVEKVVALLENWNVRLIVAGGLGGGVMEARYAEIARQIRSGNIKNAKKLAEEAKSFVPSDQEFETSFATATVSKVSLARYYLAKLERQLGSSATEELIPSPQLTLEHVLPDRPQGNWPQFQPEQHAAFVRRLGNMALLAHKMNSELKSAPFKEKKDVYTMSALQLTRKIASESDWTPGAIRQRQEALAKLAVKAWPLKVK